MLSHVRGGLLLTCVHELRHRLGPELHHRSPTSITMICVNGVSAQATGSTTLGTSPPTTSAYAPARELHRFNATVTVASMLCLPPTLLPPARRCPLHRSPRWLVEVVEIISCNIRCHNGSDGSRRFQHHGERSDGVIVEDYAAPSQQYTYLKSSCERAIPVCRIDLEPLRDRPSA